MIYNILRLYSFHKFFSRYVLVPLPRSWGTEMKLIYLQEKDVML